MKVTNELITKAEAIKRNMQVVKIYSSSSLYALPEGREDIYVQDSDRSYNKVVKRYKRIPESTCIIVCELGDILK